MMEQQNFLLHEFRWRTFASAIWTWLLSFPVIGAFLFLWIFSPVDHVFDLYDYFTLLVKIRSWFLAICIAFLCTLLLKCHMMNYQVTCDMATTRLGMFLQYFKPKTLGYAFLHSCIYGLIAAVFTSLSNDRYSERIIDCDDPAGTYRCVNESGFILILFGITLGLYNFIFCKAKYRYTLHFSPIQLSRFISIKCSFTQILSSSAKLCIHFMKYFIPVYYILGFFPRHLVTAFTGFQFCDGRLMKFNSGFCLITLVWTLWITGTFLLVLHGLSWHLFDVYVTQVYKFLVDSVFPEDASNLLSANLSQNEPLLFQHLAFYYLTIMAKYSKNKRQQLFEMNYETSGKHSLKWEVVADECLARINELTKKLKEYHQRMSMLEYNGITEQPQSTSSLSPSSLPFQPDEGRFLANQSVLRRRPLHQTNNTLNEVSTLNISNFEPQTSVNPSALLNGSAITVPTPKLWTRSVMKTAFNSPAATMHHSTSQDFNESQVTYQASSAGSLQNNFLQKIPLVAFFTKEIPSRVAANIFSKHNIYKWAVESISFLVAASLTEDRCGFVQKRIDVIVCSLLELLAVLEKNCKLPITASSGTALFLLRQQHSLKADTKSAIYRITDVFAKHVDCFSVGIEHKRKLRLFVEHRE